MVAWHVVTKPVHFLQTQTSIYQPNNCSRWQWMWWDALPLTTVTHVTAALTLTPPFPHVPSPTASEWRIFSASPWLDDLVHLLGEPVQCQKLFENGRVGTYEISWFQKWKQGWICTTAPMCESETFRNDSIQRLSYNLMHVSQTTKHKSLFPWIAHPFSNNIACTWKLQNGERIDCVCKSHNWER
jgi:hypothetical protein